MRLCLVPYLPYWWESGGVQVEEIITEGKYCKFIYIITLYEHVLHLHTGLISPEILQASIRARSLGLFLHESEPWDLGEFVSWPGRRRC